MTQVTKAAAAKAPVTPPTPIGGRRRTVALVAILLGLLLDLLDIVIVNVALPTIQEEIGATAAHMQWMVGGYTLAFATMLVTGGRLGDIYGRKKIFMIGMTGFALASLAAGLAFAPEQLIIARFVQGGMGALMVPQVLAILQVMYPPNDRGKAFSALSVIFAVGTVGGPIVGALLTTSNIAGLTWRTIFLVNLPIAVACLFITARLVPESKADNAKSLDIKAAILVGLGMLLLVFPLIQGRELGWPTWTFISLGAAVLAFAGLIISEKRRTESPLIPLSLFSHRSFRGGLAVSLFFMAGVMPFFLINTLYLQIGQGYSVLAAGLTGVVWGFAVPLFTFVSARFITPRIGRLGLQIGLVMLIVGMALLIGAIRLNDDINTLVLAPGLIIGGAGMGMTFAPLLTYTLNDVPSNDAGSASGVFNTIQQVGSVIGIALSGMVFFLVLNAQATDVSGARDAQLRASLAQQGVSGTTADTVAGAIHSCFAERMNVANPAADLPQCAAVTATLDEKTAAAVKTVQAQWQHGATHDAFRFTTERALLFQIGMFAIAILISFTLPRKVGA